MRKIKFYRSYFVDFYNMQNNKVQDKIEWTLGLIRDHVYVPEKYFKHISDGDGLFEIRVHVGTDIYRIFSFFDNGDLIVLINGFQKKTMKLPKSEIELAKKLKKEYFDDKK